MAGPTASVMFADSHLCRMTWRELMHNVADDWPDPDLCHVGDSIKFGGDYKGVPRPFVGGIYEINDAGYCCVTPDEVRALRIATGVDFKHCVEIGAMCNSPLDHRLLCEIARSLAEEYNGYVHFNGVITETQRDDLLTVTWAEDGHECSTQIGLASACDWWLAESRFHMVK
jgi:hypothetical protein